MTPTPPSEPTHGVSLAKLAALFATTFLLSLGICGYSLHNKQEFGGSTGFLSFLGIIASLAGLFAIAVISLVRLVRTNYYE